MDNRVEWEIELEKRKILQDSMVTEIKKEKFIKEIKNGLGDLIISEPNKTQKKPSFWSKIKKLLGWN
jgi:hypothetical protein